MPRVQVDGIDLSYRDTGGEGAAVVLLHGFPFDSTLWDPQFDALGRDVRLIAPDLRGFGGSSPPPGPSGYSMSAFASDVAALLDHLELPQVVLGGLSMGGYVSFELLRHHPERVMGLVLADTRAEADAPEVRDKREAQAKQVAERGGGSLVLPMMEALLSEDTRRNRPEAVRALRVVMEQDDRSWIGGLEAMRERADSSDLLDGISVPTLIVVGQHDAIAPPDVARGMSERIPGARLVVLEGAGHVSNLEAPDAFNAALSSFLEEL